ncbi:glycogen debranching enzyme GlgX, partial [Streptomyces fulvissimus]|nr:glycogen debranching enzyme GlgX [Streptomyces microflavus]
GNNNAYCQDDATSWVDWSLRQEPAWADLLALTRRLIALRRAHPVLRSRSFFAGRAQAEDGLRDLAWFTARGGEMTERDWYAPTGTLALYLSGRDIPGRDERGTPVTDAGFHIVLH